MPLSTFKLKAIKLNWHLKLSSIFAKVVNSEVASGYHIGWCGYRISPLSKQVLLDGTAELEALVLLASPDPNKQPLDPEQSFSNFEHASESPGQLLKQIAGPTPPRFSGRFMRNPSDWG